MILITGASGLLGSSLAPHLKSQGRTILTHAHSKPADFIENLTEEKKTFKLLDHTKPKIIINLIGLTDVERCQNNPHEAYLLNTKSVENISQWIIRKNPSCHLIQISTDQVYDGPGLHTEQQVTITNFYAFSKYAGELAAAQVPSTIIRTNFVGRSKTDYRESFTDWALKTLKSQKQINVFKDIYFNPLSLTKLVEIIDLVIQRKPLGIFNIGSRNGMSKSDFVFAFAKILDIPTQAIRRINSSEASFLKTYRPKNMLMNCSHFENTMGITMPNLKDVIESTAREYHDQA